jgi:hypothetical protein
MPDFGPMSPVYVGDVRMQRWQIEGHGEESKNHQVHIEQQSSETTPSDEDVQLIRTLELHQ